MIGIWILAGIVAVVGMALVALAAHGRTLDERHVATCVVRLRASPRAVWEKIGDPATYPAWAPGVSAVDVSKDASNRPVWTMQTKRGPLAARVETMDTSRRLVTRIVDDTLPFGGTWTWEITPEGASGCRVRLTEDGFVRPPLFRALAKHVFGHHATIRGFLAGLASHLGEAGARVERAD